MNHIFPLYPHPFPTVSSSTPSCRLRDGKCKIAHRHLPFFLLYELSQCIVKINILLLFLLLLLRVCVCVRRGTWYGAYFCNRNGNVFLFFFPFALSHFPTRTPLLIIYVGCLSPLNHAFSTGQEKHRKRLKSSSSVR